MEHTNMFKWETRGQKQRNDTVYLLKATEGTRHGQTGSVDGLMQKNQGSFCCLCASANTHWGKGDSCCEWMKSSDPLWAHPL